MKLSWGSPELEHEWDADRIADDGYSRAAGVVRRVWFGAEYIGPPPPATKLRHWEVSGGDALVFFMNLGRMERFPNSTTLLQLGDAVRGKVRKWGRSGKSRNAPAVWESDGDRLRYDRAVDRLLEVAQLLHSAKRGLGLLNPENILYVQTEGANGDGELVLPDWGFSHQEESNSSDGLKKLADSKWASIRDESISEANRRFRNGDSKQIESDIRALARIIEATLVGKEQYLSGAKFSAKSASARIRQKANPAVDASSIVQEAIERPESLGTVKALRERLQQIPPSSVFVAAAEKEQARVRAKRKFIAVVLGLLILVLAVSIAVVAWLFHKKIIDPWPPNPPTFCPDCHGRTNLRETIESFESARKSIDPKSPDKALVAEFVALEAAHNPELLSDYPLASIRSERREAELACLAKMRGMYVADLSVSWDLLNDRLANHYRDVGKECPEIEKLYKRVQAARALGSFTLDAKHAWLEKLKLNRRDYCGLEP